MALLNVGEFTEWALGVPKVSCLPGWLLFFIVGCGVLYVYLALPGWRLKHIPCPPYVLGVGHLPLLNQHEAKAFQKIANECGPIFRFHAGRNPVVIVADAELCRELAIKKFKSATDRSIPPFVETIPVLKDGLFFSKGTKWMELAAIVLRFHYPKHLRNYIPLMSRVINVLGDKLAKMDEKEDVNISNYLFKMSMDIIAEAAFGEQFGLLEGDAKADSPDSELVDSAVKFITSLRMDSGASFSTICGVFLPFLQHPVRKLLSKIPGTADWDQETCSRKLQERLDRIVKRRKEQGQSGSQIDALSFLLEAREDSAQDVLTEKHLASLTYEMLLTGTETTSTTLSYALYLISCHPDVERTLLKEIDDFGPANLTPGFDDLLAFPYVEQVIKETLRFYTPSPVIARELLEDVLLGGYHLPKGTSVWMATDAIMTDSKYYPDPDLFRPDRFSPASQESKKRHPYAYIPFGLGPRTCIGTRFAMQEAKLALISLYQRFTFEHSPDMEKPLAMHFGMIRRPKFGVMLRVHPRGGLHTAHPLSCPAKPEKGTSSVRGGGGGGGGVYLSQQNPYPSTI